MTAASDQEATDLISEIFRASGALTRAGDELTAEFSLSASRWLMLGALQDGPVSVAAIGRRRGLRRQSARESVQRLERDGFVERLDDPADKRSSLLQLTPAGRDALDRIEPRRSGWATDLAASLDSDSVQQSLALLRNLRRHLERTSEEDHG